MADESSDPPDRGGDQRADFEFFSKEYAQAVQAFKTIENQSSTIVALSASDDLRTYIDQFIEMATRIKALAEDHEEAHFAEWFEELIQKAEGLRTDIVRQ
jgi:prephenate dehydrogenase